MSEPRRLALLLAALLLGGCIVDAPKSVHPVTVPPPAAPPRPPSPADEPATGIPLPSVPAVRAVTTTPQELDNGASPRERPDGSDDDLVALRLRRLAEQQRDPVLKQKLWAEYLAYRDRARTR